VGRALEESARAARGRHAAERARSDPVTADSAAVREVVEPSRVLGRGRASAPTASEGSHHAGAATALAGAEGAAGAASPEVVVGEEAAAMGEGVAAGGDEKSERRARES